MQKNNWPKVSVIITTKNEEKVIGRLLKSIFNQTYHNYEVILVDNKSTDKTLQIAKNFRVKIYTKGPERSAQRNFGANKSVGQYLLFLDADMELSRSVLKNCVRQILSSKAKMITIAETTVGNSWVSKVRKFEREMYMEDPKYEVPRFFDRKVFFEFGGYDTKLTGPEDYDLPFRISKKYIASRINQYIYHHEENVTLSSLLKKKYYYSGQGAIYAEKHPELIKTQGTILFRRVYLKNWRKFLSSPLLGLAFLFVRTLETISAVLGFINKVGLKKFISTAFNLFK
jgi:glycosyltransferase involved in cell wall biosynthesis